MRRLRLGDLVVGVDAAATCALTGFLDRVCGPGSAAATHSLAVRCAERAALVVDEAQRAITLTVQPGVDTVATHIGVLQALARGVAYLERSAEQLVLLHGSAVTIGGGAVAVLDGGLGQGKTSLAMSLATRLAGEHGRLLVDEFTFARIQADQVLLSAAPTLPWHIRADMAPHLATPAGPLLYPDELATRVGTTTGAAPLRLVLIPDHTTPPGRTSRIPAERIPHLLGSAVDDHLRKFTDPHLDHVSIFTDADQVTDSAGRRLADQVITVGAREQALARLAAIPAYRVGIGGPSDLPASVAAAAGLVTAVRG